MSGYAVARLDEIDEISDGRAPWRPVRHHFGIRSFGVNAWTGHQAGDRILNEHDEADEDEELYVVQSGKARFEIGGETVEAPAGTYVFVRPGMKRTAFAEEPDTTILAIGAQPGVAYQPTGWEVWAEIRPLYDSKRYDEAAERASALVDAHPEYPMMVYNLACIESLAGRKDDALAHLRQAIEQSDRARELAAGDSDFDPIRDELEFKELIER